MATIKLEIVSPDKVVYSADIDMLIVRSTDGELGILPHHAPLVTGLVPHAMRVKLEGTEKLVAVGGGFMEVQPEKISVLASVAELPEEIDEARARKSMERAKQRIHDYKAGGEARGDINLLRAEASLQRALARLKALGTKGEA
ncbi:ATP synthase F1 subunit epsilon [uncultured Anaerovibrio sp.]|jgi:F-type H+-transporting ATPase subunit epsilon|uniref:ATP synthase F1 subunit epsilon n=1 Tax=uncultured Anaerovibrio sp. TaxID=361586 RepID=UPI0026337514|nr:ATP synthase F1 subunit epsilon [uncultured Anaerovibrio sp.]